MKPLFAALSVTLLLGNIHKRASCRTKPPPPTAASKCIKKADLAEWNRENAAGGQGPLLGSFAFTRHQTAEQDAFKEIGLAHITGRAPPLGNTNIPAMKTFTSSYPAKACLPIAKANKPKSAPATLPSPAPASPTHSKISAKSRWYSLI